MKELLYQLALGFWAMRPGAESVYTASAREFILGRNAINPRELADAEMRMKQEMFMCTSDGRKLEVGTGEPIEAEKDMVAVFNLQGPVMKSDYCGSAGTARMARWMQEFDHTPEITGVVVNLDSPGGNGYAMLALTDVIEKMNKPVVSIVQHGMACSAAYGIAAASDLVFARNAMDEFGSIGTYVRIVNWDKYLQNEGIEVHTILASKSTAKLRMFQEAQKADPNNQDDPHYKEIREKYIDPFNENFLSLVQRNRPGIKDEDEVFNGAVFMAEQAMMVGLVDSTGETIDSAIAAVRELKAKS